MLETVDFTCRYSQNALGSDEIRPISGTPYQYWGGLGMMVVESTDTLWIMKLGKEYQQALAWIQAELRFDLNHFTSVFETIIRMVGGLLSGYALTQDPVYLQKAEDLADRLMASYEGLLNHPNVNLATGAGSQVEKKSSLAEIATNYVEFMYTTIMIVVLDICRKSRGILSIGRRPNRLLNS